MMQKSGLALVVYLVAVPFGLGAQTVRGHVTAESDGEAIGLADVQLLDDEGIVTSSIAADSLGFYEVTAPGPGEYRLQVDQLGYERLLSPPFVLAEGQTVVAD